VRIDNASPEERARDNVDNFNAASPDWKHLRKCSAELPVSVAAALLRLTFPVLCVREFRPTSTKFVELGDDGFALTDDGMWLTSLMK
jgi:hypothetical protein